MNDTQQANGRLAKVLLASTNANAHFGPTMSLTWLGMQEISLHFADRTFSRTIDFGRVRYLNITNCPGTSRFLRVLAARVRKDGYFLLGSRGIKVRLATLWCRSSVLSPVFDTLGSLSINNRLPLI